MQDFDKVVRESFTAQAEGYAGSAVISDAERLAHLVRVVNPAPESRVLEVATGPGYVAEAFAAVCREVIGIDMTQAPLEIAERRRRERGLVNLHFELGNARQLPFGDETFDVVVCRSSFHHFPMPALVLTEMVRVCQAHGLVAVEDMVASEYPERAAYHNRFERLRDSSHTEALPFSRFIPLFTDAGLEIESVVSGSLLQDAEEWMMRVPASDGDRAEALAMIERDAREDLSGTHPYVDEHGHLRFRQRSAIFVGRKLGHRAD